MKRVVFLLIIINSVVISIIAEPIYICGLKKDNSGYVSEEEKIEVSPNYTRFLLTSLQKDDPKLQNNLHYIAIPHAYIQLSLAAIYEYAVYSYEENPLNFEEAHLPCFLYERPKANDRIRSYIAKQAEQVRHTMRVSQQVYWVAFYTFADYFHIFEITNACASLISEHIYHAIKLGVIDDFVIDFYIEEYGFSGELLQQVSWHLLQIIKPDGEPLFCKIIEGHTDAVYAASFSADGSQIVSASKDQTIRIWDAKTGEVLQVIEAQTDSIKNIQFSTDGLLIIAYSSDGMMRIWEIETGKEYCVNIYDYLPTSALVPALVRSIAFSPSGNFLVIASITDITIWDIEGCNQLQKIRFFSKINSALFSPNEDQLIVASENKMMGTVAIKIVDKKTGRAQLILQGHSDVVNVASFSSDGSSIVSASDDHTVKIWQAETGKTLVTLSDHLANVNTAFFSPDGTQVVSASDDTTIRVWTLMPKHWQQMPEDITLKHIVSLI